FGNRNLWPRREHVTELTDYDVKGGIVERQRLRIAFAKIDFEIRDARVFARSLEQLRCQINTTHARTDPRGGDRDHARATADIDNILASANVCELHQTRRRRRGKRLEWRKMFPAF